MKAKLDHLQINISDKSKSIPFYKDLLGYLGYKVLYEEEIGILGMKNKYEKIWVIKTRDKYPKNTFHRKHTGLNHIAFMVQVKTDVDKFNDEFLKSRNIKTLYNSPKPFPEYTPDYYAVYFEDPDRIKLEVCYHK